MSDLKPCPLCGGEARTVGHWVYCDAGTDCDFNCAAEHWQSLPRVSDTVRDVVREMRDRQPDDYSQCDSRCHPYVEIDAERYDGWISRLESAAVGKPVREVEIALPDQMVRWPDGFDGEPVPSREVDIRAVGSDWTDGIKHYGIGGDFHWVRVPVHGAPEQGDCKTCECCGDGFQTLKNGLCWPCLAAYYEDAERDKDAALARAEKAERELDARDKRIAELEKKEPCAKCGKPRNMNLNGYEMSLCYDCYPTPPDSTGETYHPSKALGHVLETYKDPGVRSQATVELWITRAEYWMKTIERRLAERDEG